MTNTALSKFLELTRSLLRAGEAEKLDMARKCANGSLRAFGTDEARL